MKLEPIIEMHCMTSALWRRFAVHLFEGQLTLADMDVVEAKSAVWHARVKGKRVEMVVILPSDAKMTSEERTRMTRIIRRWESHRAASATVILAQGLVGAMHRSVLTGMQMLAPPPHPTKVFSSVADGIQWLGSPIREVCGPDTNIDELVSSVMALKEQFARRPKKSLFPSESA
jgi:hypothetical protein